jgi:hypothetical protein
MARGPVLLLLCASVAFGQPIALGLVGGAAVTDDFLRQSVPEVDGNTLAYYSVSKDYVVGLMVEVGLPFHLSVEVDGLYRALKFGYDGVLPNGSLQYTHPSETIVTWEVPVLAKYRFHTPIVSPFVELGPSFRSSGNLNNTRPSHAGFSVGGGVEAHLGRLRIAPEVRYMRWEAGAALYPPVTNPNQVEGLVSFSYSIR